MSEVERDQFQKDASTVRILKRWVYPQCETCGHDWYRHRSLEVLPLPSKCSFADCVCESPAHIIHQKYLDAAMLEVFGESSRT